MSSKNRVRCSLLVAFVLLQMSSAEYSFAQSMSDCSYFRLNPAEFAVAVDRFATEIAHLIEGNPQIRSAISNGEDITSQLYSAGTLERVSNCIHADGGNVQVVGGDITKTLPVTGSVGFTLVVRAVPYQHCIRIREAHGRNRQFRVRAEVPNRPPAAFGECINNPFLRLLTLGETMPMPNTLYVYQTLGDTNQCPEAHIQSTIDRIIVENRRDTTDYPGNWEKPNWNFGIPTVAEANRYTHRLEREFMRLADSSEATGDLDRIYSAAYWFIQNSDPTIFTIRRSDYKGQECDIIRNRIVMMLGMKAWEAVKRHLKRVPPTNRGNVRRLLEEGLKGAVGSLPEYAMSPVGLMKDYKKADELINFLTRPPVYSSERERILQSVAKRTAAAMKASGYGDCAYFESTVYAWDYLNWKDQTIGAYLPVDWEHDFLDSLVECLKNE